MTPTELATYYRENGAKCLLIAKGVVSASRRLALVDIAQAWTALAHHAEKDPGSPREYGTDADSRKGAFPARPNGQRDPTGGYFKNSG